MHMLDSYVRLHTKQHVSACLLATISDSWLSNANILFAKYPTTTTHGGHTHAMAITYVRCVLRAFGRVKLPRVLTIYLVSSGRRGVLISSALWLPDRERIPLMHICIPNVFAAECMFAEGCCWCVQNSLRQMHAYGFHSMCAEESAFNFYPSSSTLRPLVLMIVPRSVLVDS